jgi:hypothetical protein
VEQFYLYDLYRLDGGVDENVFAYSNIFNDERGLVIYHNRFAETRGWIKISAAYLNKNTGDLRQKSLAEGLSLPFEGYVIFKDYVTHLEYIRSCEEFWQKGMYLDLHAYQHHVFMDWRFVEDSNWELVNSALNGAGVESMQAKWEEMFGVKEEVIEEEVISPAERDGAQGAHEKEKVVKKPRKKAAVKKKVEGDVLTVSKGEKKPIVKKTKATKKKLTTKKKTSDTNK